MANEMRVVVNGVVVATGIAPVVKVVAAEPCRLVVNGKVVK